MAHSGSNAFSNCGEGTSSGKGSRAFSIDEEGVSARRNSLAISIRNSLAISIRGKRAHVEESGDGTESMRRIAKAARLAQAIPTPRDAIPRPGDGASHEESGDAPESPTINCTKLLLKDKLPVESKPVHVSVNLTEYLLMKIIGGLDFKPLFRAQLLSKTFRDNFQRVSFQREVQNSSSWKSCAPLFVNDKNEAVGYDSSSREWQRLPSHSFAKSVSKGWTLRAGAGALLIWTNPVDLASVNPRDYSKPIDFEAPYQVHVSNSLTKRWRQLHPRPKMCWPESVHAMSIPENNSYKVIICTMDIGDWGRESIRLQIFDSSTDSWTEHCYEQVTRNHISHWGGEVLHNGILYMLVYTVGTRADGYVEVSYQLVTYEVASNKWTNRLLYKVFSEGGNRYRQRLKFSECHSSELVVCGSNLMQVVWHVCQDASQVLSVYRLDTGTGSASEVATASADILHALQTSISEFRFSAGKDGCIYIGGEYPHSSLVSVNVETQEWTWVYSAADGDVDLTRPHCIDIDMTFSSSFMDNFPASFSSPLGNWRRNTVAYQPGLNPFIKL